MASSQKNVNKSYVPVFDFYSGHLLSVGGYL